MRRRGLAFAAVLVLTASGCSRFQRKAQPKPFVPPPVVVRTVPPQELVITEPPANPGLFLDLASIPFPILAPTLELPERPPVPAPKPRPPVAQPAPTEVPEPAPPPVPVPKLTRILTDEEKRSYRGEVDDAARTAERVLEAAGKRSLSRTQQDLVRQVRDFVDQARSQRETDLVAARNLARRGLILARDLERTLR